ncbi:MAG: hypothetical protein CMM54_10880 [Rhodospirillaceae bacterium]|nr:hypothetical protein [Rhodospirillaceae bacterium]
MSLGTQTVRVDQEFFGNTQYCVNCHKSHEPNSAFGVDRELANAMKFTVTGASAKDFANCLSKLNKAGVQLRRICFNLTKVSATQAIYGRVT